MVRRSKGEYEGRRDSLKKKTKISQAYFNRFKKSFVEWQERLGLTQYSVAFFHEKLGNVYAQIKVDEMAKVADVFLNTEIGVRSFEADEGAEANAKHEALHLLTHRFHWLGRARYIATTDLEEECEAIVVRLEKVL